MADLDAELSLLERLAYLFVLFKQHAIERVCEGYYCIIFYFFWLLDAYDMLRARFHENSADEFWVTGGNKDKLQFAPILLYHLFELLSRNELAAAFLVL